MILGLRCVKDVGEVECTLTYKIIRERRAYIITAT